MPMRADRTKKGIFSAAMGRKFADTATYRDPKAAATGLVHLFVNGRPVVLNGKPTSERPGRLLRKG
jgi:N-acyl-D-amino-acid deacylase